MKVPMSIQLLDESARTKATFNTADKFALNREEGGSKGHLFSLENPLENVFYGDNSDHLDYASNTFSD